MFAYRGFPEIPTKIFWSQMLYVAASLIPISFLHFMARFPDGKLVLSWRLKLLIATPPFIIILSAIIPNALIETVRLVPNAENIIVFRLPLHILYGVYIVGYFLWAYGILLKKLVVAEDIQRVQLIYILVGTFVATAIGVFTNLLLPLFGVYTLNWAGQVGVVVMITAITYAMLRHHLFNIKVVLTELVMFVLWIILFTRIFLANNVTEQIYNALILAATVIGGVVLIRSVIQEFTAREKIQNLANDIATANERLKELDNMKSEFVSLATHQIRAPLSAIKGYASLILEGSFGRPPKAIEEAVQKIMQSSESMVGIVDDFLNISRIEQGRMKYDFENAHLEPLVMNVAETLRPTVTTAGLKLSVSSDGRGPYKVHIDAGKIRQVITNLVDNAIKYTPHGSIHIMLAQRPEAKSVLLSITDTGVGLTSETIGQLFEKFVRAKDASKVNVQGTGLGLYVAKEMVKAHGGRLWAESEGVGKGSTFFMELPLAGTEHLVEQPEFSSEQYAKEYLGKTVAVTIDRPLHSAHPKYGFAYELNYGFVPGTRAPDGEAIDAYVLGVDKPIKEFTGRCIAIIHRVNDNDDKLIIVPEGVTFTDEEILKAVHFVERFFTSTLVRQGENQA